MPIPPKIVMYDDQNNNVFCDGLFDKGTGLYFDNTAQVTATLYDFQGNSIPGCTNIALSYKANSNGYFSGPVGSNFAPILGDGYELVVIATQGSARGKWQITVEIQKRKKS